MSQASTRYTDTHKTGVSLGDIASLVLAALLLIAFWVLPWVATAGMQYTGTTLLTGIDTSAIGNPGGVLLIPIAGIVGLLAGVIGIFGTGTRHVTRPMAVIGGVVGLIYYIAVYRAVPNLSDIGVAVGIGFWIGFVASLGLIVQAVLPRPQDDAEREHSTLRTVQILLVVIGLVITGYMSYNKLSGIPLQCSETGLINCSVVENSAWSRVAGIPTALLGFIAHAMLGTVWLLESRGIAPFKQYGVLMLFGIALFSVMYHAYLTYVSVNILKALCPYCLAAATTMVFQLGVCSVRLKRYLAAD